jgi:hypothetical protein
MLRPSPVDLQRELRRMADSEAIVGAPLFLREIVVSSYSLGYRLATLEASLLLESPPISTEQLLHLDRRKEGFVATSLEALRADLPAACLFVHENTMGELGVRTLLRRYDVGGADAAAAGWNGDRYLVARCADELALLWLVRWDSDADAGEFARAYESVSSRIAADSGSTSGLTMQVHGREIVVASRPLLGMSDGARKARRAPVVNVVDAVRFYGLGAPAVDQASATVRQAGDDLLSFQPRPRRRSSISARR